MAENQPAYYDFLSCVTGPAWTVLAGSTLLQLNSAPSPPCRAMDCEERGISPTVALGSSLTLMSISTLIVGLLTVLIGALSRYTLSP